MPRVAPLFLLGVLQLAVVDESLVFGQQATATLPTDSLTIPATDDGLPARAPCGVPIGFRMPGANAEPHSVSSPISTRLHWCFSGTRSPRAGVKLLATHFPDVKIANRGISGDTTRGMLIRLQEDVLSLHPRGVVLLLGTNDLEEGAEPAVIAHNVGLILAELKRFDPQMPIILCQVFPSSASKQRPAEKIRALNALYQAIVQHDPQVTLLDTWTLFADEHGDAWSGEFPDLLHPNEAAYTKWAAALRPVLATESLLESEPDTFTPEPGFTSLFNGRDLTGWGFRPSSEDHLRTRSRLRQRNPAAAPTWPVVTQPEDFAGRTSSTDGRYVARHGRLIVKTPPEGRRIQQLSTTRDFPGDFTLKLEFRATPNADSGVFIRGPQLQCRDYLLAGPYSSLKSYRPQDWNELIVEVQGDTARCTCNGELLEADFKLPETGPIGLEGDRGQMEYRRIRISQSPPAGATR